RFLDVQINRVLVHLATELLAERGHLFDERLLFELVFVEDQDLRSLFVGLSPAAEGLPDPALGEEARAGGTVLLAADLDEELDEVLFREVRVPVDVEAHQEASAQQTVAGPLLSGGQKMPLGAVHGVAAHGPKATLLWDGDGAEVGGELHGDSSVSGGFLLVLAHLCNGFAQALGLRLGPARRDLARLDTAGDNALVSCRVDILA